MAILDYTVNLEPFWDDEYKRLTYISEPFNNDEDTQKWLAIGYPSKFTGEMCDMRMQQPSWNDRIVQYFADIGWKDIGTSYYRMSPGTILPVHQDTYKKYIQLFNLQGREKTIRRAIVFLEDWKSGHYLELKGVPVVEWKKGFTVIWNYDEPHMAANMGEHLRYTLQVTGHL